MGRMDYWTLRQLGAVRGAASEITIREATGDKSVTLDELEKRVLECSYPEMNFPRRGGGNRVNEEFQFYIHSYNDLKNSTLASLSIVYPKSTGNEIRLYFRGSSGFTIDSDTFREKHDEGLWPHWYIFKKRGEEFPHIGMCDATYLKMDKRSRLIQEDVIERGYQLDLQNVLAGHKTVYMRSQYKRSIKTAVEALKMANFTCEADPSHETFISAASGHPFVEAHHLIPLSYQEYYRDSIDVKENIVALCPNCHSLIHYGPDADKRKLLLKFLRDRQDSLLHKGIAIDEETLLSYYLF